MNWRRGEEAGRVSAPLFAGWAASRGKEVGGGFGWKERNFLGFQRKSHLKTDGLGGVMLSEINQTEKDKYCVSFLKKKKKNIYIYIFGCAGSSLLQGLLSGCGAWASHCGDFSCCRARALGCVGFSNCSSQDLEHKLSCSMACGIFPDQGSNTCLLCWQVDSLH